MTSKNQPPAEADYQQWFTHELDRNEWLPDDPYGRKQAFLAGWHKGMVYLAQRLGGELEAAYLPQALQDELLKGGDDH